MTQGAHPQGQLFIWRHPRAFLALIQGSGYTECGGSPSAIADDLPQGFLNGAAQNADPHRLVGIDALEILERRDGPDQRHTAARDDAFLDRRPRGV
jgi:hypothetical protein